MDAWIVGQWTVGRSANGRSTASGAGGEGGPVRATSVRATPRVREIFPAMIGGTTAPPPSSSSSNSREPSQRKNRSKSAYRSTNGTKAEHHKSQPSHLQVKKLQQNPAVIIN